MYVSQPQQDKFFLSLSQAGGSANVYISRDDLIDIAERIATVLR
jgi:hypothetical protein